MARVQSRFVCQSCGAAVPRWEGQCRTCGEWNTLVETVVRDEPRKRPTAIVGGAVPVALSHADDGDSVGHVCHVPPERDGSAFIAVRLCQPVRRWQGLRLG